MNEIALRRWVADGVGQVIDIREHRDAPQPSPKGALPLSHRVLPEQLHYRSVPLLLLDVPHSRARSFTLCEEMSRLGFSDVSVLRYGIYDWVKAGGKLRERERALSYPPEISAEGLFRELHREEWVLITVRDTPVGVSLPRRTNLEQSELFFEESSAFEETLHRAILSALRKNPHRPIVVSYLFNHLAQERTALLQELLERISRQHLTFFLADGVLSLVEEFEQMEKMTTARNKREEEVQCTTRR
ncbi:rhodanese-like domain-containing protein [bacterium]|nr:rhodanese-like domain-containing protein [bacterium]